MLRINLKDLSFYSWIHRKNQVSLIVLKFISKKRHVGYQIINKNNYNRMGSSLTSKKYLYNELWCIRRKTNLFLFLLQIEKYVLDANENFLSNLSNKTLLFINTNFHIDEKWNKIIHLFIQILLASNKLVRLS